MATHGKQLNDAARLKIPKTAFTLSKLPEYELLDACAYENLLSVDSLTSEVVQVRLGHGIYHYIKPPEQVDPRQSKIYDFFCEISKTDEADDATRKVDSAGDMEVKKNEDMFHVHKDDLCKTSAFLQAATKQVWRGRPRKPIDLTTENAADCECYVQWLYSGRIAISYNPDPQQKDPDGSYHPLDDLIDQYLLGGRIMDPTYQNAVMKVFIDCITMGLRFDHGRYAIQNAYKGTMAGDPMRKLLLDFWIWTADETWDVSDIIENAGKEFTQELLAALLAKRTHPGWFGKNRHMRPWTDPQTQGAYSLKFRMARRALLHSEISTHTGGGLLLDSYQSPVPKHHHRLTSCSIRVELRNSTPTYFHSVHG